MRHPSRVLAFLAVPALLAVSPLWAADSYGKGITLKETTPVSTLLEKPDLFVGKTVAVSGMIVDVCGTRGCWLQLAGDKPYRRLLVKVDDGVIVFPLTARGKSATVQGVLETQGGCGTAAGGEPFPGTAPAPGDCGNCPSAQRKAVKEYELRATGAVIR